MAVRRYQEANWGSITGETALLELSAIATPNTSVQEALRLKHLPERITTFQARITEHRPKFVLFYGGGRDTIFKQPYLEQWSKIADMKLEPNTILRSRGIVYVATPHPTAHGLTTAFWTDLGHLLATFG